MYNPQRWPYCSHFTGTDLIVSHIERYVCPTISSDQLLGGSPFRFANDTRPHLVMLIAEDEYRTQESLPAFAAASLGRDFRVTVLHGSASIRNDIPGIEVIADADVLLVSVRRRVLPPEQLKHVREHVAAGKPVIGIRTASHAFSLRKKEPPEGHVDWPEFDADVFGGNYHNHHGNKLKSTVRITAIDHPITNGLTPEVIPQGWSLYQTSPLAEGTEVLTVGTIEGLPSEPVSWTFQRRDGGRSFYSSMGNVDDFRNPRFTTLLYRGICWAAGIQPSEPKKHDGWTRVRIPLASVTESQAPADMVWLRSAFRLPAEWTNANDSFTLRVHCGETRLTAWVNGEEVPQLPQASADLREFQIQSSALQPGEANLLVLRGDQDWLQAVKSAPSIAASNLKLSMQGYWQVRRGSDEHHVGIPLPAKFGAPADIVFSPPEPLWTARTLTQPNAFTSGIEGPACDSAGNILAVNYQSQGTIGRVAPDGSADVYVTLPEGSIGNGIRFDGRGDFFVADYAGHNILKVDSKTRAVTTLAHNSEMNQPNDLAIAPDGTLYASDPAWESGTGQLWRIDMDGSTTRLVAEMGTTNGIEVSPDGMTLYVNESVQRNVWAFDITADRTLRNKRLVRQFSDHGFDGMRCDADGNLYITRYGAGSVVKMTPDGEVLKEVMLPGARPSNVCFGGSDGCTVYVTLVDNASLVSFRVDRPGRSWVEMHSTK
jgi:sugar lactone lactonase YvrE/type 1 glutamine amidotransferase